MLALLLAVLSAPVMAAELPWSGCAERAVEVVRASVPAGGRVAVSPFVDMGGRLNYFGEALTAEVKEALGRGATPYVLLEPTAISSVDAWLGGSVIDGEKDVSVAATLSVKGNPGEAVHCQWNKDSAFAEALRQEVLRRRGLLTDERAHLDGRIAAEDDILAKGVWREGPRFQAPASPAAKAAALPLEPAATPAGRWTFWASAYYETRTNGGLAAAVRARTPGGRWEGVVDFGHYSRRALFAPLPSLPSSLEDRRGLDVTYLRATVERRYPLPVRPLPNEIRRILPDGVRFGAGFGAHWISERQMDRLGAVPFVASTPPIAADRQFVRIRPHLTAAFTRGFGQWLQLEAGIDYTAFGDKEGPADMKWGGLTARLGGGVRFF